METKERDDKIGIKGIACLCIIGVGDEERRKKQRVIIDVTAYVSPKIKKSSSFGFSQ